MKVETLTGHRLRVWLTEEETRKWGLLDAGEGARRLVRRALHMARVRTDAALLAEVFPVEGGCVLLLSPRQPDEETVCPRVYHVAHPDSLCGLAEGWCRLPPEPAGQPAVWLYEMEEGYRVAVCPLAPLSVACLGLLETWGEPAGIGEGSVAAAAEHGRLLGGDGALRRLGVTAPVPPPPAPEAEGH